MQHLHCGHESTYTHHVVLRSADFFGLVVHGIELSDLVTVADSLEQLLDAGAVARSLEVGLLDSHLRESVREQKVHRLWLVAVIGVVRHGAHLFVWNIDADGWRAKRSVSVLRLAHGICAVSPRRFGQVDVGLQLTLGRVAIDALSSIPVQISPHLAKSVTFGLRGLTLAKVFNSAKHVLCNGFLVLNDLLHDDRLGEGLLDPLGHDRLGGAVEQLLLAVTERMRLHVTSCVGDSRICRPVVVTRSLLPRAEVTVRSLVHFGGFIFFFHRAARWIEHVLCVHTDACGHTE